MTGGNISVAGLVTRNLHVHDFVACDGRADTPLQRATPTRRTRAPGAMTASTSTLHRRDRYVARAKHTRARTQGRSRSCARVPYPACDETDSEVLGVTKEWRSCVHWCSHSLSGACGGLCTAESSESAQSRAGYSKPFYCRGWCTNAHLNTTDVE